MLAYVECGPQLFEAIEQISQVATESEFIAWIEGPLLCLLPHEIMLCGIGLLRHQLYRTFRLIQRNFPLSYLEHFRHGERFTPTPTMLRVLRTGQPQMFSPSTDMGYSPGQLSAFRQFDLRNVVAHGLWDPLTGLTSYFGFSRVREPLSQGYLHSLNILMPSMHAALQRIVAKEESKHEPINLPSARAQPVLSSKEEGILQLMSGGKTNWEIAKIVGCSEHTIKTRVHLLLQKLNVSTRTQAAAWWLKSAANKP